MVKSYFVLSLRDDRGFESPDVNSKIITFINLSLSLPSVYLSVFLYVCLCGDIMSVYVYVFLKAEIHNECPALRIRVRARSLPSVGSHGRARGQSVVISP